MRIRTPSRRVALIAAPLLLVALAAMVPSGGAAGHSRPVRPAQAASLSEKHGMTCERAQEMGRPALIRKFCSS